LKGLRQSAIVQHKAQVGPSWRPGKQKNKKAIPGSYRKSCIHVDGVGLVLEVACFYIQFPGNDFHHAIYIPERTICELRDQILRKVQIHTRSIFHQNGAGSNILVDNEFVRQIPDRQVMIRICPGKLNCRSDFFMVVQMKEEEWTRSPPHVDRLDSVNQSYQFFYDSR
jgi:hypothetical protein